MRESRRVPDPLDPYYDGGQYLRDLSAAFETRAIQDVTGINKHAMERIALLSEGSYVSNQKDPLGAYRVPGSVQPATEIPPITEWPDGGTYPPVGMSRNSRVMPVAPKVAAMDELTPLPFGRAMYYPDVEIGELPGTTEWLSLAKAYVPDAVKEYVRRVESGETREWCRCPWAVHPDHESIPEDHCTSCREHKDDEIHSQELTVSPADSVRGVHHFKGRAIRRKDTHPMCPAHTKEGLILGFFEHLFKEDSDEIPAPDSGSESGPVGTGEGSGAPLPDMLPRSE